MPCSKHLYLKAWPFVSVDVDSLVSKLGTLQQLIRSCATAYMECKSFYKTLLRGRLSNKIPPLAHESYRHLFNEKLRFCLNAHSIFRQGDSTSLDLVADSSPQFLHRRRPMFQMTLSFSSDP